MTKYDTDIIEYYHLAKTTVGYSRYDRMIYVQKWIKVKYPDSGMTNKQWWNLIDSATSLMDNENI